MELKHQQLRTLATAQQVLIVPFMELKQAKVLDRSLKQIVLIVPFMELKHVFRTNGEKLKRS